MQFRCDQKEQGREVIPETNPEVKLEGFQVALNHEQLYNSPTSYQVYNRSLPPLESGTESTNASRKRNAVDAMLPDRPAPDVKRARYADTVNCQLLNRVISLEKRVSELEEKLSESNEKHKRKYKTKHIKRSRKKSNVKKNEDSRPHPLDASLIHWADHAFQASKTATGKPKNSKLLDLLKTYVCLSNTKFNGWIFNGMLAEGMQMDLSSQTKSLRQFYSDNDPYVNIAKVSAMGPKKIAEYLKKEGKEGAEKWLCLRQADMPWKTLLTSEMRKHLEDLQQSEQTQVKQTREFKDITLTSCVVGEGE